MKFETIPYAQRKKMIEGEKNELKDHVPVLSFHHCPKCGSVMNPVRPTTLSYPVPSYDYRCPKCRK